MSLTPLYHSSFVSIFLDVFGFYHPLCSLGFLLFNRALNRCGRGNPYTKDQLERWTAEGTTNPLCPQVWWRRRMGCINCIADLAGRSGLLSCRFTEARGGYTKGARFDLPLCPLMLGFPARGRERSGRESDCGERRKKKWGNQKKPKALFFALLSFLYFFIFMNVLLLS